LRKHEGKMGSKLVKICVSGSKKKAKQKSSRKNRRANKMKTYLG
jgi:hypothetical protein